MVKILWVDDEVELLKPHVLFLQGKGYEVDKRCQQRIRRESTWPPKAPTT